MESRYILDQTGVSCSTVQATNAAATQIGVDRWRVVCTSRINVQRHIQTCETNDHVVDDHMDALVINLRDDSCDSNDAEP